MWNFGVKKLMIEISKYYFCYCNYLEAIYKDVRRQRKRGLTRVDVERGTRFADKGVDFKNFLNYVVSTRKRGLRECGQRREEVHIRNFVRTSFMTVP